MLHSSGKSIVTFCKVCEHFRQLADGERPVKPKRGRPKRDTVAAVVHESWSVDPPLPLDMFLPPAHSHLQLEDLQCKKCMCIADRPVTAACGGLFCYICAMATTKQNEQCPACGSLHDGTPNPAGKIVTTVIGSLLLHCTSCGVLIELQSLKQHQQSSCSLVEPPAPSKITLEQLLLRPANAPLTTDEKKLATSLVRRQTDTSSNVLTLPTGGQVHTHASMHAHTHTLSSI